MADVFLSYASDDRERVAPLVDALELAGFSVWWDRRIDMGTSFDREIERELDAARSVLVVWSTKSVDSEWVRTEANEGLERGILIPLQIDDVRPPLAFRRAQTAQLIGWPSTSGDLSDVIERVANLAGGSPRAAVANAPRPAPKKRFPGYLIVLALLIVVGAVWWVVNNNANDGEPEVAATADDRKMIVVLPFENLGGDPAQEFFADGMTEEMIIVLGSARADSLGVIARTSAMHFKDRDATIETIGQELGVDFVVEGSVRRQNNRVRITANLIQVANQTQLWADSFDGSLDDIFALQNDVANRIAEALAVELLTASPVMGRVYVPNAPAYDAYLTGRFWSHKATGVGWKRAIEYFETAVLLDPGFALAHANLADAYANNAVWGGETARDAYPKANRAAGEAHRLNPELAEAHAARAIVKLFFEWDWDGAEAAFREALVLNPSNGQLFHHFGHYLDFRGRHEEALDAFANALALDPLSAFQREGKVLTLVNMGELEKARITLARIMELDPTFPLGWYNLGNLHAHENKLIEAISAWERAVELSSGVRFMLGALGYAYARAGRIDEAHAVIERLTRDWPDPGITAMDRAKVFSGLGEVDRTFELLEQAYEARDPWIIGMIIGPGFAPVNDDPRFTALLARLGVSE
jgi:TolB-like protein/tetratricopeptide (TPR) repeat protein